MGDTNVRITLHNRLKTHYKKVSDHGTAPLVYHEAKELLIRSEEIFKQFEEVQVRLISTALDDAAFKIQEKEGFKVEETYISLRSKLRPLIESLDPKAGVPPPSTALPNIKLPSIDLPKFDGSITEWTSFKDLFSAAVGSNAQLGAAQKLQYLKSSLQGEPAALIGSLAVTDLNYSAAWKQLNDRYDNTREIVHALINKLLNLREIKCENATDLQKLVDSFVESVRALEVLKRPTDKWDDFLVVILLNKLDVSTKREWAIKQTGTTLPTFKELIEFLRSHVRGLQAAGGSVSSSANKYRERPIKVHMAAADRSQCVICSGSHSQFNCPEMKRRSINDRKSLAVQHRLCFNCLGTGHQINSCSWNGTCRKCGKRHHTLLHSEPTSRSSGRMPGDKDARKEDKNTESEQVVSNHLVNVDTKGLLMTAVVNVTDKYGALQPVRVFIDGGSQAEFISEDCCRRLGLKRRYDNHEVKGFGGVHVGKSRGAVRVTLQNRYNCEHSISFDMLVLSSLGDDMPSVKCKSGGWQHLKGLELADPCWHNPGSIDMVIGSQYLHKVLLTGRKVPVDEDAPVAWETVFGWVVSGKCVPEGKTIRSYHISVDNTDAILRRFWEVEDIPPEKHLTAEEQACEEHFISTHSRDTSGRFVVCVPFTDKKEKLGRTRDAAVKRLLQVERKLQRNPDFKQQYTEFMQEYIQLGHMIKVSDSEPKEIPGKTAHLPHHGVINESSSTTKMRVVFDGSAKSSTGISLNETMMVGAMLQEELYDLLLRFRIQPIALKADIAKMFRQFKLGESDADFHRIVWRNSPSEQIGDYKLTTVTYGTASAPYLATRCLHQLALDCRDKYPEASSALLRHTYIDDILAGASCKEKAVGLYRELAEAVGTAGLELRKWSSNDPDVLAVIPQSMRETEPLSFDNDQTIKALGVQWHPSSDSFQFKVVNFKYNENLTKRNLLSDASRVFDPLGLISCFSVRAKMLLQDVWKVQCEWEERIPEQVEKLFCEYKVDLEKLTALSIPRLIIVTSATYEVHGFCDSSEKAFGAICYLRSISPDGTINVNIVTSKTRVAPVKSVSLPRLELEAAVMLSRLVSRVVRCLELNCKIMLWSDSTITLTWIAGSPHRWKTFVGNRVAKIQRLTNVEDWNHVPGSQNPADLASRGATAADLLNSDFWWKGPSWLSQPNLPKFKPSAEVIGDLEEKVPKVTVNLVSVNESFVERFSSVLRLKRVTAYLLRWIRRKQQLTPRTNEPLSVQELQDALFVWIKMVQRQHFNEEITALEKKKQINVNSKLKKLNPYLDSSGILRVAGRLQNAKIPESHRHQIILPASSHLTKLLIESAHLTLLHGGFQVTFGKLQREYWILRGRDRVRHLIRSCVLCRRYRAQAAKQMMGNLPTARVEPSRPFLHTGVDYAGPFILKNPIGRAPKTYKGYMCLFVCMVTKAIHLEPVSSLSAEGFLEAFRRFVSRRGLCTHAYSDNGGNFVSGEKELRSYFRIREVNNVISDELSGKGVQWHFNPPVAPHHGGLWEAGVKSAKHHLRRVMGNSCLTYESFHTILCQVEAVLNSRPLYAMSADPADFQALTPGHFLIGESLTAVPSPNLEEAPSNRLNQFQRQQQRVQHFWRRWSAEYLNTLQQRNKWLWESENVKCGGLVLLVEECSPGTWRMGRIVEVHPGGDGLVRTATVQSVTGLVKRSITKLIPLINNDESK